MNCPVCRDAMEKIKVSGVIIDECQRCGGLWFDHLELKRLDEVGEGSGPELERILSRDRASDERSFKLKCPKCDIPLYRHEYCYKSDIYIDECYNCGGVWLDAGELKAIRDNFKTEDEREALAEQLIKESPTLQRLMAEDRSKYEKTMESSWLSRLWKLACLR